MPATVAPPRPVAPVPPRPRRALVLFAVVLVLVSLVGTGCVRVRAGIAISPDDAVSGQIDVGTPDGAPDGAGPPLLVPPDIADDVELTRYEQDGYVGSRIAFSDLTFEEASRVLPAISPTSTAAVGLQLRRVGDRVILSGQVDLTRVPPESADIQLRMAFPGEVRQSDGTVSGGVVAWTFPPGAVTDVNAVVEYEDPDAPSWVLWALGLFALVAVAAGLVAVLAAADRPSARDRTRR